MSVYKLYTKKVRGQEDFVYLYLYHLSNGKKIPQLTSLKIKVPKKDCIYTNNGKDFKRVSKELPEKYYKGKFNSVDHLNKFLTERLEKFITHSGVRDFVPNDEKLVNDWFKKVIDIQMNIGTKMRYSNVLRLLETFQKWYSKNILKRTETHLIYFKDFDIDLINSFHQWLQSEPQEGELREKNTENSSNFKIKALKSIVNKSHFQRYYHFPINPFDYVKFKFTHSKIDILTLEELKKMIDTKYIEVLRRTTGGKWGQLIESGVEDRNKKNNRYKSKHTLEDIRNYWLFQLFCQGIRVSDMVTLRWNDFEKKDGVMRINKTMVKTKHNISIKVNEKMTSIISKYIIRYSIFSSYHIKLLSDLEIEKNRIYESLNEGFCTVIYENHQYYKNFNSIKSDLGLFGDNHNRIFGYLINQEAINKYSEYLKTLKPRRPSPIPTIDPKLIHQIQKWFESEKTDYRNNNTNKFLEVKTKIHDLICQLIEELSNSEYSSEFVFTLLNNNDFKNITNNNFSYLTEIQYKKFQGARSYYNKLLKLVGDQSGIGKNKRLTSHLARHSYTSLMLDLGENISLFDTMTSLGHKHITTTQTYIQRFDHKKIDKLNEIISDKLDSGISIRI
jgi:integrase